MSAMEIRDATAADWPEIWPIFEAVVRAGETYAYDLETGYDEGRALWMERPPARVAVAVGDDGAILGTSKMSANRGGNGAHVGTASFMVSPAARGHGVGRALGEDMIAWSRAAGFRAIQFNAVVESNVGGGEALAGARLRDHRDGPGGVPQPERGLRRVARDAQDALTS